MVHSQRSTGFIFLELLASLMALALLAGIWAQLAVQVHLAEHRSVAMMQALQVAVSHIERLRALAERPCTLTKDVDQGKLSCQIRRVPGYEHLWLAIVEVTPIRYPEHKVVLTTCGCR